MIILLYIFVYLVGSIPTGYWLVKYFHGLDITKHGSGNIGATNVSRVLGSKKYFLLIFLIDACKASLALLLVRDYLIYDQFLVAGVILLLGNGFSVFMRFRGGKGVATALGVLIVVAPHMITIVFLISWVLLNLIFRRSDIASLATVSIVMCSVLFISVEQSLILFLIFLFAWIFITHRANIRLLIGFE